jgi:hypothetical protein
LDEITINYPIPGHSFMEIDSDFGRLESFIRKREKIFMPSEYAKIIELTNSKNPFQVIEVNYTFSNNERPIVIVSDYKKILNPILRQSLDHCTKLRIIKFDKTGIKASLKLNSICDIDINLFNKKFDINQLESIFIDIPKAYDSVLPIKRDKLLDTQLLLKHVEIPSNDKFYDSLYSNEVAVISKSKSLIHNYIEENNIHPKAKRVKK